MTIKKFLKNYNFLADKTVLITGADGGIGSEISKHFASLNCNLIFANRDEQKTKSLIDTILKQYPNTHIKYVNLDLCNKQSVETFLKTIRLSHIDYFIHNAGVYNIKRKVTDLGFDNIYQTNCLMPYYITKKLLPYFKQNNTKIIYMGSFAYKYSKINFEDIQFKQPTRINKIYGNSKRVAMYAFSELFKQNPDIKFSIAHPGLTLTKMTNHYHKSVNWLVRFALKIACPPPQKAGLSVIYATNHNTNGNSWIGPKIFNIWGYPKCGKFKMDTTESQRAFEFVEKQTIDIEKQIAN